MNYHKMTKEQLLELAAERDIEGRTNMTKGELVMAHRHWDLQPASARGNTPSHERLTLDLLRAYAQQAEDAAQRAETALAEIRQLTRPA